MEKETKNTVTREEVRDALIKSAKGNLFMNGQLLLILSLVVLLPMVCIGIYIAKKILILGLFLSLPFLAIPIVFSKDIIEDLIVLQSAKQGTFSIALDRVERLSRGELPRKYSEGRHTVDVIYFEKYGRCIASKLTFDLTSVGDAFYVVVLHRKKKKPLFIYHSLMYECNEVDTNL